MPPPQSPPPPSPQQLPPFLLPSISEAACLALSSLREAEAAGHAGRQRSTVTEVEAAFLTMLSTSGGASALAFVSVECPHEALSRLPSAASPAWASLTRVGSRCGQCSLLRQLRGGGGVLPASLFPASRGACVAWLLAPFSIFKG